MTKEKIFDVFKELIYEHSYEVSRDVEINMESRIIEDLNIDSLDRVNIVIAAEKAFDIELDDDAVADFLAGNLRYNPNVQCNHHSHHAQAHSCGDHDCSSHHCGGHCH